MSELEPIGFSPAADPDHSHLHTHGSGGRTGFVAFSRSELSAILSVYGRMVAKGEWRDYGIDMLRDRAVFYIFRRASEQPLYTVEKRPRLARKQGAYLVIATTGLILKRGNDLEKVMRVLDRRLTLVKA
ncbi:MAG: DUF2794 domain-containing protein [Dichotomicrobium sp.]